MPLDEYIESSVPTLEDLVNEEIETISKPISEYRDSVTQPPAAQGVVENAVVEDGRARSLEQDSDILTVAEQTSEALFTIGTPPPAIQRSIDFQKNNTSVEGVFDIVGQIREEQYKQEAAQREVDLVIADTMADYSGIEKLQDFVTSVIPFNDAKDNVDTLGNMFKGGALGEIHQLYWSTDDPAIREGVLRRVLAMSEDMEKSKVVQILGHLRDPEGAADLDSFFGVGGGFWFGFDVASFATLGTLKGAGEAVKGVGKVNRAIKDAVVNSRPVDALAKINPKKSRQLLKETAEGNVVDPAMSKQEAVLKADVSMPDGIYKQGVTQGIYDETLPVTERAKNLVDAVIGNNFITRESMLSNEFIQKVIDEPSKFLATAKKDVLEFLDKVEGSRVSFKEVDEVLGDKIKIILGDDAYANLRKQLASGADPQVKKDLVTKNAQETHIVSLNHDTPTPTSVRFEYGISYPTWSKVVKKEQTFTIDSIDDTLGDLQVGGLSNFLGSNTAKYKDTAREIAKKFLAVERLDSRMSQSLRGILNAAMRPIGKKFLPSSPSGKSLNHLDQVFQYLDDLGDGLLSRNVTTQELLEGAVKLDDGTIRNLPRVLKPNEVEAFQNLRGVFDQLQRLGNAEERRRMKALGLTGVKLENGTELVGKVIEDVGTIKTAIADNKIHVPHFGADAMKELTEAQIDDLVSRGYVLIRTQGEHTVNKSSKVVEKYNLAMVHSSEVTGLPMDVRGFKFNYVPRVSESEYWVRSRYPIVVNGKKTFTTKAVMQTDHLDEAEEFIRLNKDNPEFDFDLTLDAKGTTMAISRNREVRSNGVEGEFLGSGGAMSFSKSRAGEEVPYGLSRVKADRVNTFEAFSRYTNNLSGFVSRNEMRIGIEKAWLNDAIRLNPSNKGKTYASATLGNSEEELRLLAFKKQIDEWSRIPTSEELWWQRKMQATFEWAMRDAKGDGVGKLVKSIASPKIAPFAKWAKAGDPVGYIRNVAFNMYLGFMNPVQLIVQAQQSAITAALHPKKFLKATKLQFALSVMDTASRGGHISKKMYPTLRKVFGHGMKDEELDSLFDAWNRSGMFESVVNTADYAAVASGKPLTGSTLTNIMEAGQLPYRMGVLSEKRVNFIVSYLEWAEKNAGKKINSLDLKAVTKRADEYSFEMGRMNRANWQKGILSLPTQFYQIFGKTIENMMPAIGLKGSGNFTQKEALRLFAGIAVIYGAAGNPLTSLVSRTYKKAFEDEPNLEEVDTGFEDVLLRNGLFGLLPFWVSAMTGEAEQFEVGSRLSPISGLDQLVGDVFFEKTGAEIFFGAAGGLYARVAEVWDVAKNVTLSALDSRSFPSTADYLRVAETVAGTASSFRNLSQGAKAMFLDEIRSANGVLLKRDVSTFEGLMKSMGIISTDLNTVYTVADLERHQAELFKAKVAVMREAILAYSSYQDLTDPKVMEELQDRMAVMVQSVNNDLKKSELMRTALDTASPMLSKEEKQAISRYTRELHNAVNESIIESMLQVKQGAGE